MRGLKTPIRIVLGVIEQQLEVTVTQRSRGGVKVELRHAVCWNAGWLVAFCIKLEHIVAVLIFGGLKLFQDILVAEQSDVVRHLLPYRGTELFYRVPAN